MIKQKTKQSLNDDSSIEQVDAVAAGLRVAMTRTLDEYAKKKRWASDQSAGGRATSRSCGKSWGR
jgi:hypothetical protein